jgi:isoquinoline 1-oxidoreductase alpha subunit
MYSITINGKQHNVDVDADMPLLWVIRDIIGLTGTKYSCGISVCGACTVHMDGKAIRSCVTPIANAANKSITTIEGLSTDNSHPVQRAWIEEQVPQCGYCQSGQIMQAVALLKERPNPTDKDIDEVMSGILCRCGTYQRIRKAIKRAAQITSQSTSSS